jgi:hypothetical protein
MAARVALVEAGPAPLVEANSAALLAHRAWRSTPRAIPWVAKPMGVGGHAISFLSTSELSATKV